MKFYITQFGAVWSITEDALRTMLAQGAAGGGGDLNEIARPLRTRFSESSLRRREGFLPKRWRRDDVILLMPLDWKPEMFRRALDALNQQDWNSLRYGL